MPRLHNADFERYADYAEQVRIRPNPKANRPRTKRRPEHKDAVTGMVTAVDRGRYTVLIAPNSAAERLVVCARARELHKTAIVIGDSVQVVGDTSGHAGTLGRIVRLNDRTTLLRRSADDSDTVERVMVANATQMLIVVAAASPEPRVGLVDRSLAAAYDAGIKPLLCVTKTDLHDPSEFLQHFAALEVPVFLSTPTNPPLAALSAALINQVTVFVGHSGVGKSTLINMLVPAARRATGRVNAVTGRGRHTSSSSVAFEFLPAQLNSNTPQKALGAGYSSSLQRGWVIDTPGVRSFGLGHVSAANVISSFQDLADFIADCPRGCNHAAQAPDCELNIAQLSATQTARLASLRRLLGVAAVASAE